MDQNTSSHPMPGMTQVPLARHVSPCLGEPNWAPAHQNHAALHSILHVPSNPHDNSWSPAHLTAQPSPDCKTSVSFRDSSYAGTRCDTGNILTEGRHLAHRYSLQFFVSTQESPQIPLHLAFWKLHFLQLKERLGSRLRIIFTPCAAGDADITWHNTKKEGILSFATRLTLLLQVHWENCLTRHTNPSAFNGRELPLQKVIESPFSQVTLYGFSILPLHLKKKKKEHSDGALFYDTKSQPLLGVYTQKEHRHVGKWETQGNGQGHPGDIGTSTPSGTLTFLKDGISYYLLSSLLCLVNLITWSSEFNNSKGTMRSSRFRFSFHLCQ